MPQLSDAAIRAAKPLPERYTLWDGTLKGFGLRVFPGGAKTFIVLIGSGRRQSIGHYGPQRPGITLSEAREQARNILAEKQLGKVRPKHHAYDDAKDAFLKECETRLRPLTVKLYRRHLTTHFPFERKSIGDITPREIVSRLNRLNDRPGEKEHAYRIGRTFFEWCVKQHILDANPVAKLSKPPSGKARERVLTTDELAAVWDASQSLKTPFCGLVALLVATGARRGEMTLLKRIGASKDSITFPAETTKGGVTRTVPIGQLTASLIERIPKRSEWVFPAARGEGPMTGYSAAKRDFDRACGVTGWTLHDLRRTYATNLQRLGVRLEVIETLLGHVGSRSGIVGIYQRYGFEQEAREAVEKYERYLHTLRGGEHADV